MIQGKEKGMVYVCFWDWTFLEPKDMSNRQGPLPLKEMGQQTHQKLRLLGGWEDIYVVSHMDLLTRTAQRRLYQTKA